MPLVLCSCVTKLLFTWTRSFEKFINEVSFILLKHIYIMIFTPFSDLVFIKKFN